MAIHGSCLCGAVEFEIDGRMSDIGECHCSICRRANGARGTATLVTAARSLSWLSDESGVASFRHSDTWSSDFCPTCGSPVPRLHENGKVYLVPAGILDGDPGVRVANHIFVGSKAAWDEIGGDAPQHDEWDPDEAP